MPHTSDLRIRNMQPLLSPRELVHEIPVDDSLAENVAGHRATIGRILSGEDKRLLAIVGPCSIHDTAAALVYARKLSALARELSETLFVVMRVYFEKPRTTVGWKGFLLDPGLDGAHDIQDGLRQARKLLVDIGSIGLPAGTEALDPIVPQYISDLISWSAIGARTTESQTHREMASGLSMPVGFKNGTDGSIEVAVNAMLSSRSPHSFIGIDSEGRTCMVHTTGNDMGHLILRGGKNGPNYYREHLEQVRNQLAAAKLPERVIIDCSHANSGKDFKRQRWVLEEIMLNLRRGQGGIKGFMLESNLVEGRQDIPADHASMVFGKSVTDACLGWEETEELLRMSAGSMR